MFTATATSYGSLYNEQNYSFNSTSVEDQTFEIREVQSGDLLGVKKFYNTSGTTLNISPIVRPFATPSLPEIVTEFVDSAAYGAITIEVTKSGTADDGATEVTSGESVLTLSKSNEDELGLLTTLPLQRSMSMGERELLALRVDPELSTKITVSQFGYGWDDNDDESQTAIVKEFTLEPQESGIAVFSVAAECFEDDEVELSDADLERIEVTIEQLGDDDEAVSEITELTYFITEPTRTPIRLAWISSRGALEHYTMPVTASELIFADGHKELTLRSALETYDVRTALSEILYSDYLWIIKDGQPTDIELVNDSVELYPTKDFTYVELKISVND